MQSVSLGSVAASGDLRRHPGRPRFSPRLSSVELMALVELARHLASFVQRAPSDPSSLVSVGVSEELES